MRDLLIAAVSRHQAVELPLDGRVSSAVMVLVEGRPGEERLVFQVRTQTVRVHKGEISFPGGRRDPEDADLRATALRETHEEVGVPPEAVSVLGVLDDTPTVGSNHMIRPFVGLLAPEVLPAITAQREVHELLSVPLVHLLDPSNHVWRPVERDGVVEASPAFAYGEHVIWGATARILTQFLSLLRGSA